MPWPAGKDRKTRRQLLAGAAGVLGVAAAEVMGQAAPAQASNGNAVLKSTDNGYPTRRGRPGRRRWRTRYCRRCRRDRGAGREHCGRYRLRVSGPAVFSRSGVLTVAPGKSSPTQTGVALSSHFGPADEADIAFLVETMRLTEPLIVGTGVAAAEQIGMDTFEQRLRQDNQRSQAVAAFPMLLSAWATTGPQ